MRFLADMGISPKVVELLRSQGHEALHLHEEGLGQLPDVDILKKARKEGRIVLTHDLDFAELLALGESSSARWLEGNSSEPLDSCPQVGYYSSVLKKPRQSAECARQRVHRGKRS